jgi:sortase A
MYTCYPFDELGLTDQRFFVYAKYVSGPQIDKTSKEG